MIIDKQNSVSPSLKIIFSGTNEFSLKHFMTLINTHHKIVGLITKPELPSGRGQLISNTPIKKLAQIHNIPIFQPISLRENNIQNQLTQLNADIIITVAYGKIIPKSILTIFPLGGINVHASLLPKWRGPSPIQSAILNGDKQTGITVIQMNQNIDEGRILYSASCPISFNDTSHSLQKKLSKLGCKALLVTLNNINIRLTHSIKQSKLVTYSKKITKQDAQLSWIINAIILERYIRAFNPWPICFFTINKVKIRVWSANVEVNKCHKYKIGEIITINKHGIQIQTKNNILNIKYIQLPGKKIINSYNICNSKYKLYPKYVLS